MIGAFRQVFARGVSASVRRNFASITKYTKEHEWVTYDDATKVGKVGITDHAQNELGDIVFVKMPSKNSTIQQHDSIGEIESVKAVATLYSPVSGEVVEINTGLEADFGALNKVMLQLTSRLLFRAGSAP